MAEHGHSSEAHDLGHIVPVKTYVTVLLILFFLTFITVWVSGFDFGDMNIVVAILIATIKAFLVGLFFMHLKYENYVIWVYVIFPIALLWLMIGGIFLDNPTRINPTIYSDLGESKGSRISEEKDVPAKPEGKPAAAAHH